VILSVRVSEPVPVWVDVPGIIAIVYPRHERSKPHVLLLIDKNWKVTQQMVLESGAISTS
jgi:hypothetical protein